MQIQRLNQNTKNKLPEKQNDFHIHKRKRLLDQISANRGDERDFASFEAE